MLRRIESINKSSYAAILSLLFLCILYLGVAFNAEAPAGGQDSWNHYLFARWCFKHPMLMLDLWGKPFFTILAAPCAQFGINAVYGLNFMATLATAWLTYLCGRKLAMRNAWMLILLFGLQPVVFANFYSALTEPTNALVLALVLYFFISHRYFWALFIASFLPIIRTEGLVIIAAMIPFVWFKGKIKYLPLLFSGTLIFALLAAYISGEWDYFISHNPYFKFEADGKFDPGAGSFWHYAEAQKSITGLWITLLMVITGIFMLDYVYSRYKKRTPHEMSQLVLLLLFPIFGAYFFAHSFIWYAGMMGSHGLIRVFAVVAPAAAIIAHYSMHRIMSLDIRILNQSLKVITTVISALIAYTGAGFPYPHQNAVSIPSYKGAPLWYQAIDSLHQLGYKDYVLVHQVPELNVHLDLDPYDDPSKIQFSKNQYLWSLDTRKGYDWFPSNTVILWENFHARRDAPMPLDTLRSLGTYSEIFNLKHPEDTIYDVRVFVKNGFLPQKK